MPVHDQQRPTAGIFITFSGNCKEALCFYQTCFGGMLRFKVLNEELAGYSEPPVISGSLLSDRINIYGSDLVYEEGRKIGNHISIFLPCKNTDDRMNLIRRLAYSGTRRQVEHDKKQMLIEIADPFDVRWLLSLTQS